jgi:putative sugar O-methyltransferase
MAKKANTLLTAGTGYEQACLCLLSHLKNADEFKVLEKSEPSATSNVVVADNKRVSWDYLLSVKNVQAILKVLPHISDEEVTVLDLGVGWGRIGHVLMQLNPKLTYIDSDLPEPLLLAQEYLPTTLPQKQVYGYGWHEQKEQITCADVSTHSMHFVGTHHIPKFEEKSIDLVINVTSMQEMDQNTISEYFDLITQKSRAFYNSQCNTRTRFNTGYNKNEWPIKSTWKTLYDQPTFQYDGCFEAVYLTS